MSIASIPGIVDITDSNFEATVAQSSLPVVIDFWAEWCRPCRAIAPQFDALAAEYAGRVRFGKCDIDGNQGIASRLDIRGVPTFLAFGGGKVVAQILGAAPRARLDELVRKAMAAAASESVSARAAQPSPAA